MEYLKTEIDWNAYIHTLLFQKVCFFYPYSSKMNRLILSRYCAKKNIILFVFIYWVNVLRLQIANVILNSGLQTYMLFSSRKERIPEMNQRKYSDRSEL